MKNPTSPTMKIPLTPIQEEVFAKYIRTISKLEEELNILKEGFTDFCRIASDGEPVILKKDGLYTTISSPEKSEKAPSQGSSSSS